MKKYIAPEIECRKAMVQSVLTTSLPVDDTEVNGDQALGKGNLWDDED